MRITRREALRLEEQHTLFGINEAEAEVYQYATHFRRQLKVRLLNDKIVTQIVRETTLAPNDFLKSNGQPTRRLEDPAAIAWKLSTGAYYKDGGRPWQLADVRPGVCYVGLAYKRRDPTGDDSFAVCAAQMFLSSGEGVVFRGALGPWYRADSEQFHLDELAARNLVKMVIDEYHGQHNNEPPAELFLHAKSSFTDEEWKGFTSGAPPQTNVVGVQIADGKDNLKLFRPGKYPWFAARLCLPATVKPSCGRRATCRVLTRISAPRRRTPCSYGGSGGSARLRPFFETSWVLQRSISIHVSLLMA